MFQDCSPRRPRRLLSPPLLPQRYAIIKAVMNSRPLPDHG